MSSHVATVDEFIGWLEGRMGRKLKTWERGKVMDYLKRIWLELQV